MSPRQSPGLRFGLFAMMLVGTALAGWGLFHPLVRFPVVGSLGFSESSLGGSGTAVAAVVGLALGGVLLLVSGVVAKIGLLLGGVSVGYVVATLRAIYRANMDKALELADSADSGIRALLEQREFQPAAWCLAAGLVVWVVAALATRWHGRGE